MGKVALRGPPVSSTADKGPVSRRQHNKLLRVMQAGLEAGSNIAYLLAESHWPKSKCTFDDPPCAVCPALEAWDRYLAKREIRESLTARRKAVKRSSAP